MYKGLLIFILQFVLFFSPSIAFARVTANDIYQERQSEYQSALSKISDPAKKQAVEQANQGLMDINQSVCARFDSDVAKMAAILDELKRRQGVNKTVVAYGQGNTPLDNAAYWLNYAEEAVAYQKAQDYTPDITNGNLRSGVGYSMNLLSGNLNVLQGKVSKAKSQIESALNYYEK